jgi:hypothetical protein
MQNNAESISSPSIPAQLADFGQLQAKYQSLPLSQRAEAVLRDAEPALKTAESILQILSDNKKSKQALTTIRKNLPLAGKLRPSEAKNMLMDPDNDFIQITLHKLAAWRKTMERLSHNEDIKKENGQEYLPANSALALAVAGNSRVSNYLSIIQLILAELIKADAKNASQYNLTTIQVRRCSTILSDCEVASDIATAIH